MIHLLFNSWESPKKALFVCTALILLIGGIFLFLAFSTASADSREARIDQLTSDLENSKDKDEKKLKELAQERKELLIEEAITNPEGFLRATKLAKKNGDFSSAIQSDLEQEVEIEGDLSVVHFDGKDFTKTDYKLRTKDKKVFDLHFADNAPELQTGSKVKVKAVGIDSHLVVAAAGGETSIEAISVASSLSTGEIQTAVLLVNFSNDRSTPVSKAQVNDIVFSGSASVNAYYQENSFNQTSLTGQVFGWYKLTKTNSSCATNWDDWQIEADNLATASGVDLSLYDRIVYVFPTPPLTECPYGGMGDVGGAPARSWIYYPGDIEVYTHELGHNLGIHHANSLACGSKAIDVYTNCINEEYGDPFDIMGMSYDIPYMLQFNGAHKVAVGWIPSVNITTVTSDGTFKIYPLETASANTQILKIAKADTGESYVVSYRQPTGFDISLPSGITRGASIHVMNNSPSVQTKFLDTTPGTGDFSGFGDAALQDSKKFTDTINNIEILQTSHTSSYAEVQVSFSVSAADTTAPSVAITYPANGTKVTKNVKITVTATASDNVGIKKVEFRRNGSLKCTDTTAPYSCSMFTNTYAGKQVTYQAKAFDAANNYSTSQVKVTTK